MSDKIEAISKVNQTQGLKAEGVDPVGPEKFQEMMETKASSIQPKFEVLDPKAFANASMNSQIEFQQTHFNEQDVSSNAMGSATDEEKKDNRQSSDSESDEIEGVSGVSKSKGSTASNIYSETSATAHPSSSNTSISIDEIKKQSEGTVQKIEEAKQQLVQANQAHAEIKPSYQKLLKNHLQHIDDNIRIASSKVGIENPAGSAVTDAKAANPVERFINMLTSSQAKMKNLQKSVDVMAASGTMNPGQMLALQIKSNLISQEMELFSSLLGKALEGIKTIMNIQV